MFSIRGNLQGKCVDCQSKDIVPHYHPFTSVRTQACTMVTELHVKRNVVHVIGRHSTLHARQHRKIEGTDANEHVTSFWNLSNSKGYSIAISGTSLWKFVAMPSSPTTSAQSY